MTAVRVTVVIDLPDSMDAQPTTVAAALVCEALGDTRIREVHAEEVTP